MIEKMKKVSLVLLSKDLEAGLAQLANAQVFHSCKTDGTSEKLSELQAQRGHVSFALEFLPKVKRFSSEQVDILNIVDSIHRCHAKLTENEDIIISAGAEMQASSKWGEFDREDYDFLLESGFKVGLYEVPKKEYFDWQRGFDVPIIKLSVHGNKVMALAMVHEGEELPVGHEFDVPQKSSRKLALALTAAKTLVDEVRVELSRLAVHGQAIKQFLALLDQKIDFEIMSSSMGTVDELSYITGYIPVSSYVSFKELCAKNAWAALYEEVPEDDESVPTKLKHYGVGAMVKPLLSALDLLPGYREFDITFVMFFFFTVFFAMIIGDAGYGTLFSIFGIVLLVRNLAKGRPLSLGLVYFVILSLATVVWGALTGNWFGYVGFKEVPVLGQWVNPWFDSSDNLMRLCFWIGTTHLLLAHGWAFVRAVKTNFFYSLSQIGNFLMIFSLQYLVYLLLLNQPLPGDWILTTIFVGFGLVVLFNQQQPGLNPFKQALVGLANIFPTTLGCVGNFSDIISYIRLYAVGLAGFSIANAFNGMALSFPEPVVYFVAPLLLLLAHGINIMLSLLSIIVHGLRLNSLEFSSHLGLEWKGIAYKPFGGNKR
ncbi:MAG: hypothetical protein ACRCVN_06330 [Spirochaetia bacterium]